MDMFIKIKIGSLLEEQFYFMPHKYGGLIIEKLKIGAFMNNNCG